jgi:hypothetical protein
MPPATVPPATIPPAVIAPAPIPPNVTPLPLPPAPPASQPEVEPYLPPQPPPRSSNAMSTRRQPGFIQVAVKSNVEIPSTRFSVLAPAITMTTHAAPKTAIASPTTSATNLLPRILPFMAE